MKIKNHEMVAFLNGFDSLVQKKLPNSLGYALLINQKLFTNQFVEAYQKKQSEMESAGDREGIMELLNTEIDANIQTVPSSIFSKMDDSDKYDALSVADFLNISFMITNE